MARVRVGCTYCARGMHSETLVLSWLVVGAQCWPCRLTLCRCLWSMSAVTYFVKMSAGLSWVPTLWIVRIPVCTSCCMNRYLRSMCFAFLLLQILVAMLLPLVESVCILTWTLVPVIASLMKFIACSTSCAAVPIAYSFLILLMIVPLLLVFCFRSVLWLPVGSLWTRFWTSLLLCNLPNQRLRAHWGRMCWCLVVWLLDAQCDRHCLLSSCRGTRLFCRGELTCWS